MEVMKSGAEKVWNYWGFFSFNKIPDSKLFAFSFNFLNISLTDYMKGYH